MKISARCKLRTNGLRILDPFLTKMRSFVSSAAVQTQVSLSEAWCRDNSSSAYATAHIHLSSEFVFVLEAESKQYTCPIDLQLATDVGAMIFNSAVVHGERLCDLLIGLPQGQNF
jgi:hypothetical protein